MSMMWAAIITGSLVGSALLGISLQMLLANNFIGTEVHDMTASAPIQPASTKSAPAESAPAESAPAESAPAESAPAESAPAESAPTAPNLISYWKFDGEETGLNDFTSFGNNGVLTGTESYVEGKIGKALNFDGSSYITLANEPNFDFERTNPFSISFWLKSGTSQDLKSIVYKGADINSQGWGIFVRSDSNIHFQLVNTDSSNEIEVRSISISDLFDGMWHHICITYDGSSSAGGVKIYYDGISQWRDPISNTLTDSILNDVAVKIGGFDNDKSYTGEIDDFRVYNKELSADEVLQLYNFNI